MNATSKTHEQRLFPATTAYLEIEDQEGQEESKESNSNQFKLNFEYGSGQHLSCLYKGQCPCKKQMQCKNYIVLGQTGAGKSTFLDSFISYLINMRLHENKRYKLINERAVHINLLKQDGLSDKEIDQMTQEEIQEKVQTKSITSRVTVYHIPSEHIQKHFGGINQTGSASKTCINLIDVPGFADVGGEV